MKGLLFAIIFTAISHNLLATEAAGDFVGECIIDTDGVVVRHFFHLSPNEKANVGFSTNTKIEVLNNLGHENEGFFYALAIAVSDDRKTWTSPPRLCPTSPESAKLECEEDDRRRNPPYVAAPKDHFALVKNTGYVLPLLIKVSSPETPNEPVKLVSALVDAKISELKDGLKLIFHAREFRGSIVSCSATYFEK